MIEALQFPFFQHAIVAGILVSLAAGIIGSLIVVNRMVFLSGGIAHASYGGIGMALYFGIPVFLGASLFAVAAAMLIAYLTLHDKTRSDTFIGLIWAVGMAIGVIFTDMTPGYHTDLMSYLFGSILAVTDTDLWMTTTLLGVIVTVVLFRYREIVAVSYDSEFAMLRGISVSFYHTLMLVLSALTVVIAIKVVGLILVIAMLTIPVYIAEKIARSLWQMMILSGVFCLIFTLSGLWLSYRYDLTSGASIILVSAAALILFVSVRHLTKKIVKQ